MDIKKRIKQLQSERKWTNYRLCAEAQIPPVTLSNMYSRNTMPSIATLTAICGAFGLSLAQFFLEDEEVEVLSAQEKALLEKFRRLPEDKRKAVIELL